MVFVDVNGSSPSVNSTERDSNARSFNSKEPYTTNTEFESFSILQHAFPARPSMKASVGVSKLVQFVVLYGPPANMN